MIVEILFVSCTYANTYLALNDINRPIMAHRQYKLEYSLERASFAPLWNMLSTDEGLSRWMDCQVCSSNGITRFQWSSNETDVDEARTQISADKKTIRFRWLNKEGEFSFEVTDSELTKDSTLIIKGDCDEEDYESDIFIWEKQVEHLIHLLGLHLS